MWKFLIVVTESFCMRDCSINEIRTIDFSWEDLKVNYFQRLPLTMHMDFCYSIMLMYLWWLVLVITYYRGKTKLDIQKCFVSVALPLPLFAGPEKSFHFCPSTPELLSLWPLVLTSINFRHDIWRYSICFSGSDAVRCELNHATSILGFPHFIRNITKFLTILNCIRVKT